MIWTQSFFEENFPSSEEEFQELLASNKATNDCQNMEAKVSTKNAMLPDQLGQQHIKSDTDELAVGIPYEDSN